MQQEAIDELKQFNLLVEMNTENNVKSLKDMANGNAYGQMKSSDKNYEKNIKEIDKFKN